MIGIVLKAVCGFVFDNRLGQMFVAGLAGLALFGAWLWRHDAKVEARVETKIVETAKDAGKKAAAKAARAHKAAAQPGAADRLLKSSCRDCKL